MLTMVINPNQSVGSRIFSPSFAQPIIPIPQLGMVTIGNMSGGVGGVLLAVPS